MFAAFNLSESLAPLIEGRITNDCARKSRDLGAEHKMILSGKVVHKLNRDQVKIFQQGK